MELLSEQKNVCLQKKHKSEGEKTFLDYKHEQQFFFWSRESEKSGTQKHTQFNRVQCLNFIDFQGFSSATTMCNAPTM